MNSPGGQLLIANVFPALCVVCATVTVIFAQGGWRWMALAFCGLAYGTRHVWRVLKKDE
jgi:hypothetical protein